MTFVQSEAIRGYNLVAIWVQRVKSCNHITYTNPSVHLSWIANRRFTARTGIKNKSCGHMMFDSWTESFEFFAFFLANLVACAETCAEVLTLRI